MTDSERKELIKKLELEILNVRRLLKAALKDRRTSDIDRKRAKKVMKERERRIRYRIMYQKMRLYGM